jgi:outer membrane protein OmpA-like peptidoglycan-associated protein
MKLKFLMTILLFPSFILSQKNFYINPYSNSYWLGIGGGTTYIQSDFSKSQFGFYSKGEFEYFFESYSKGLFGIKLAGGYGSHYAKNLSRILIGSPARNSIDFLTYFLDAYAGLTYLINLDGLNPYLTFGGYSTYWYKVLDEKRNDVYETKRNLTIGFFGETGLKINLADGLTLNFAATFNYPNTDEIDGRVNSKKDVYLIGVAGFSIYFGGVKDSDKDGVIDRFDMCPNTPFGINVDEFGCPVKTLTDRDGDGVEDSFDKCPDTPYGVVVDKFGCPVDSDGDVVPDFIDKCPGTPIGFPVDEKGCPLDSDKDGVLDPFDECPDTPFDVRVNDKGCPIDSDSDGVPDYLDKCPQTPLNVEIDEFGCPREQKPEIEETSFILQGMTTFEVGKSVLTDKAKAELKRLAEIMKKYQGSKWRIEGHTDSQGSSEFNKKLSQERADAVKKYLISLGIKAENLIAEGMGENYPIADNKTEEGRQKNRRVVITKIK